MEKISDLIKNYDVINEYIDLNGITLLKEERNLAPNTRELFLKLQNVIAKELDSKNIQKELHFNENIFGDIDRFFIKADILVRIDVNQKYKKPKHVSRVNTMLPENSAYNCVKQHGYPIVEMEISVQSNLNRVWEMIASSFYHELHHAYEDFRRKISSDDNTIGNYHRVSFLGSANNILQNGQAWEKPLGYVLYHLSQVEQRAFIAGGIGELEVLMKNPFNEFKGATRLIKSTRNYESLEKIEEKLEELKKLDVPYQMAILKAINTKYAPMQMVDQEYIDALRNNGISKLKSFNIKTYEFHSYKDLMGFFDYKYAQAADRFFGALNQKYRELKRGYMDILF